MRRIGKAAAAEAKRIPQSRTVRLRGEPKHAATDGDVRENLSGIRSKQKELGSVSAPKRDVPVLGEYDVVVIGGGTGGAPAGIAAARQGAKTLVVEYLHGLGGVGTMGYISSYYYGYIKGFTEEVDEGVARYGGYGWPKRGRWNVEWKKQWYRSELRRAGADIWFGCLGGGAFVDDRHVKGVVVATPEGRGVIRAKVVIDSTGNADIAAEPLVFIQMERVSRSRVRGFPRFGSVRVTRTQTGRLSMMGTSLISGGRSSQPKRSTKMLTTWVNCWTRASVVGSWVISRYRRWIYPSGARIRIPSSSLGAISTHMVTRYIRSS